MSYQETDKDIWRNELLLGAGITALGGVIGFLYQMSRNRRDKSKVKSLENDMKAGLEGALVGVIISLAAVLIYRTFFHAQTVYGKQKAKLQTAQSLLDEKKQFAQSLATGSVTNGKYRVATNGSYGGHAKSYGKMGSSSISEEQLEQLRQSLAATK